MKKLCFTTMIATLVLCILGCTSKQSDQLTEQQKDQIKKEVKATLDNVIVCWQRLDAEGALQSYSSDMEAVGGNKLINFTDYKKDWIDYCNAMVSIKVTPIQEDFKILTKDLAYSTWIGSTEISWKSGGKTITNPQSYVDIYKKVGTKWVIIYEHFSGCGVTENAPPPAK
jgi:hypothetical protein